MKCSKIGIRVIAVACKGTFPLLDFVQLSESLLVPWTKRNELRNKLTKVGIVQRIYPACRPVHSTWYSMYSSGHPLPAL